MKLKLEKLQDVGYFSSVKVCRRKRWVNDRNYTLERVLIVALGGSMRFICRFNLEFVHLNNVETAFLNLRTQQMG